MVDDKYRTVKEVADHLLVSEATVRNWIKDGDLRAIELGKGWRISDSDLNAFLLKHATRDPEQDSSLEVASTKSGTDESEQT